MVRHEHVCVVRACARALDKKLSHFPRHDMRHDTIPRLNTCGKGPAFVSLFVTAGLLFIPRPLHSSWTCLYTQAGLAHAPVQVKYLATKPHADFINAPSLVWEASFGMPLKFHASISPVGGSVTLIRLKEGNAPLGQLALLCVLEMSNWSLQKCLELEL
eukprot:1154811-Pelagomonas_calceolata.AAC.4